MSDKRSIDVDLCIIGGGIAGLWTLALAHARGYNAVLIEKDTLGGKQTILSQGIIHGGSKYALQGKITGATETISGMPKYWLKALEGKEDSEVKLTNTKIIAQNQLLIPSASADTKLLSFFGSKTMASYTEAIKASDLDSSIQGLGINYGCFKLFEPVLAIDTLIQDFYQQFSKFIFKAKVESEHIQTFKDGTITVSISSKHETASNENELLIHTKKLLLSSGEGFSDLNGLAKKQKMQLRPLHMLSCTSPDGLPPLFAHFIGRSSKPTLTITSYIDHNNKTTWYIGGDLAENGVKQAEAKLHEEAKQQLVKLMPKLNTEQLTFKSHHINRAEPKQSGLLRPDDAYLSSKGNIMVAWPTKLALAPRLAEKVMQELNEIPKTSSSDLALSLAQLDFPKPQCAAYAWDE